MKDGILILDKPQRWTSHDCVALCRAALRLKGVKKIGHGGTLDPMAEGLLPIFIGQATRIMEYMDLDYKTYKCRARLGLSSDTQDIWGETIREESIDRISEEEVRDALKSFEGVVDQMPPDYSAVRIDGKRLYEYARSGSAPAKKVEPRRIHIESMLIDEIDLNRGTVDFEVKCSKGTYIRTICHDLGQKLGCGGTMESLRRTAVGDLNLSESMSPDKIKAMSQEEFEIAAEKMMLPADAPLMKFGEIRLDADRAEYFRRGNSTAWVNVRVVRKPKVRPDVRTGLIPKNARGRSYDCIYRIYDEETGEFLGTGFEDKKERLLKADKVFAVK